MTTSDSVIELIEQAQARANATGEAIVIVDNSGTLELKRAGHTNLKVLETILPVRRRAWTKKRK